MSISLDENTKRLFALVLILVFGVITFSTYKYYAQENYTLYIKTSCDPTLNNCFVQNCDSEEDIRCPYTGDYYYKIILKNASQIPSCLSDDSNACGELTCNDDNCEIIYCSEENIELFGPEDTCSSISD
ncbi:MAG: hypothetical protein WBL19_01635 [Minisyncoccia bacterium]